MAHDAGIRFAFGMTTGIMPILADLAEVGYDLHYQLDPVNLDLPAVKRTFNGATATLGGVSTAITLNTGTKKEIEEAVATAVATLGPTGFILSPVDSLYPDTPWSQVEVLINAWRQTWG